jgi:DNA replication protein DnaC
MPMVRLAAALEDVLSPFDREGAVSFSALWHEVRMARYPAYAAWWAELAEEDRGRHQQAIAELEAAAARRGDELAERRSADAAREAGRARDRLADQGVPGRLLDLILRDELEATEAIVWAKAFLVARRTIAVFSGARGTGKTVAAAWLVSRSPGGVFLAVSQMARISRYRAEEMEPLERCPLLAIDDLGTEFVDEKGSFLATLDGLINARYADDRRTVITTNLPAESFKKRYGERIADRIREAGRFLELKGESLRGRKST